MRNLEWIILDDLKMNLIAALITLLFAASFNKTIQLPFKLQETEVNEKSGDTEVNHQTIHIAKEQGKTIIRYKQKTATLEEAETILKEINPNHPIKIASQKKSGVTVDQLITIIASLRKKGAQNVSILAATPKP